MFPFQLMDGNGVVTAESLLAAGMDVGSEVTGEINDGTVLYIDPNDPQVYFKSVLNVVISERVFTGVSVSVQGSKSDLNHEINKGF